MKQLPIGINDFKTIIEGNYYFVDKSKFIEEILKEKVVLYKRPYKFGKTLNMSMLYYFFSNQEKENAYLFDGLKISRNEDALKQQNQYPVIFISLESMTKETMDLQLDEYKNIISQIITKQFSELFNSSKVDCYDKEELYNCKDKIGLKWALCHLTHFLQKYYQQEVIVLLDDYDTPLQAAYQNGYYDEMVDFLRSVFSSTFKTNFSLETGVLMGCLHFFKESVFTGFNNYVDYSIFYDMSNEYFGFTKNEAVDMLKHYHLSYYFNEMKKWYGGYRFKSLEMINPFSSIKYIYNKINDKRFTPTVFMFDENNKFVENIFQQAYSNFKRKMEQLIKGHIYQEYINKTLTYDEVSHINNINSFLLHIGYMTMIENVSESNKYTLLIPNKEIYEIYKYYFDRYMINLISINRELLYHNLIEGKTYEANIILCDLFTGSIRFYDNEEHYFYKLLLYLLGEKNLSFTHDPKMDMFNLCIFPANKDQNVLLLCCNKSKEINYLRNDAKDIAEKIRDSNYIEVIKNKGYQKIIGYGISFCDKQCILEKNEDL